MSKMRFFALQELSNRKPLEVTAPSNKLSDYYGSHVFDRKKMQEYLPKEAYKAVIDAIEKGTPISREIADLIANGMKSWAKSLNVTHYTHWFQPLTDGTAEKHDGFIEFGEDGGVIERFSGKLLIQQEPDASSFPNGGIRNTFEARGYTAWDVSSPAFVVDTTLCIPTIFISYTGEALDYKTPLLKALAAVDKAATEVCQLFDKNITRVYTNLGWEQEYFLVDSEKFLQRKDLIYTGRTLFGAMPPKGQEMDDHYFGTIRQRIASFMKDVNEELWKVGVTAKTQHNEAAPAQHELAPIYAKANIAVDHNQIVMQTLKRVASRHGMKCLLHEKPFAGVNGSGKHNNWSLITDDGINMLEPGKTPHENIQFLLVLTCVLKAVNRHAELLRESAADPGNDHRLGANEAPPAIISVFLGEQLEDVIDQLVSTGEATHSLKGGKLETSVRTLPDLMKDATDRNRTSPFAFTGNKFEFRMVGSRDSIASANIVLNTIVAEAFSEACDVMEQADDVQKAIHDLIKEYAIENQKIIFNGDGYSQAWVEEAQRRGLPNIKSMVESIPALVSDKSVELFEKFGVFTRTELESRAEIRYENYSKALNIEARTMIDMGRKQFIPAIIKYTKTLADTVNSVKAAGVDASVQLATLDEITVLLKEASRAQAQLEKVTETASSMDDGPDKAAYYYETVCPAMEDLRAPIDKLEMIVDKEAWPMPSYGDLIFEV